MTMNSQSRRRRRRLIVLTILLSLLAGGFAYQAIASGVDENRYPPPGDLVSTSHGDLHLVTGGQGDVTVVFEAGQGDTSLEWSHVQQEVAGFARVCSYDRPGLGWSSPGFGLTQADEIAQHLHDALEAAEIPGPYVLAGHSIGGVYVRAFADLFPEEVSGIVLVDSAHEDQQSRLPNGAMKDTTFLKWLARILHLPAQVGIVRATRLADLMQGENYDERIRPAAMARMYQSHFFRAILNDVRAVEFNTSGASPPPQLGDLPLVVLSRGPDAEYAQIARAWDELQAELAQISTNSIRIIAEESGHYIHRDQPELVIDAIRRVVNDDLR